MPILTWSEEYSVKVTALDNHTQQLFDLVNQLSDAKQGAKGKDVFKKIIYDLADYTLRHFDVEEKLLALCSYPDLANHKKAHDDFANKVMEVKAQFDGGNVMISTEFIDFLKDWLSRHIMRMDKKYGPFLNGKGVS